MKAFDTTEITVPLKHLANVVQTLISRDVFFFVMPYPDDDYKVGVRTCEANDILTPIVAMMAVNDKS